MDLSLTPLGTLPITGDPRYWIVAQLSKLAAPYVKDFLADPAGKISRLGDLLIWQSASGSKVLITLEGVAESQAHVEQVVGHIETAQIGLAHGLGTLTSLSMFGFGTVSLASGFMIWRMNALNQRLGQIGKQISDIQAALQAEQQAFLQTALDFLDKHERHGTSRGSGHELEAADENSNFAMNLYRNLIHRELEGERRPIALNQCGRYYMLAMYGASSLCDIEREAGPGRAVSHGRATNAANACENRL